MKNTASAIPYNFFQFLPLFAGFSDPKTGPHREKILYKGAGKNRQRHAFWKRKSSDLREILLPKIVKLFNLLNLIKKFFKIMKINSKKTKIFIRIPRLRTFIFIFLMTFNFFHVSLAYEQKNSLQHKTCTFFQFLFFYFIFCSLYK